MKAHAYAEVFPMMSDAEIAALAADIKANGLRDPIITLADSILDGRNRFAACQIAGVEPKFEHYSFTKNQDPLAFVVSRNLHRRHLDASQRAMIAAKMARLPAHRPAGNASKEAVTQASAARLLNVSRPSVQRARTVLENASPEQIKAVEKGEASVSAVARAVHPAAAPLPPVREHAPEDNDSETIQLLKTYWRRATKLERRTFLAWVESKTQAKKIP